MKANVRVRLVNISGLDDSCVYECLTCIINYVMKFAAEYSKVMTVL